MTESNEQQEREHNERLNRLHLESLEKGQRRSTGDKIKQAIDLPFQVVSYGFKLLVVIGVFALIGAGIYVYLNLNSSSESKTTAAEVIEQPNTPQPGEVAEGTENASEVSPEKVALARQILAAHVAVTECLTSAPAYLSIIEQARFCSAGSNLKAGEYQLGDGPGQVQLGLQVLSETVKTERKVGWSVQVDGQDTNTVHGEKEIQTMVISLSGSTPGAGLLELVTPGSNYLTDEDGRIAFWLQTQTLPPCTSLGIGQECLVQQPVFDPKTDLAESWAACYPSAGPAQPLCQPRPGSID